MGDALGIGVEGKNIAALAQQVDQVSTVSAAGIENPHLRRDVAAQDLVEDVDVDLAELVLQAHPLPGRLLRLGHEIFPSALRFSRSMTLGGTILVTSPPSSKTPLTKRELT